MRILYINHEKNLNGAGMSLLGIIDGMYARNHSIYILTSHSKGPFFDELSKRDYVHIIIKKYYGWCQAKTLLGWIKNKTMWPVYKKQINRINAKKISKLAINEKIDLIHTNSSIVNIGGLISKYSGIPHIWHLREFGDLDFGMEFYESRSNIFSFMNNFTNRFICVSRAVSNHYHLLDEKKKNVVYNGIDQNSIIEPSERKNGNNVRILIAGAVFRGKGQHEAVAACEMLLNKGIDNFELLIAGKGSIYFPISQDTAKHIYILGYVSEMKRLRKAVDIELVCSRCEAFGRVTAEAMLAGIPVVGSNTGGTPELIEDGIDGFLYEKGNINQLAKKIEALITNPKLRQEMGRNAQIKAKNRFLISNCVSEIERIYHEVIAQSKQTTQLPNNDITRKK